MPPKKRANRCSSTSTTQSTQSADVRRRGRPTRSDQQAISNSQPQPTTTGNAGTRRSGRSTAGKISRWKDETEEATSSAASGRRPAGRSGRGKSTTTTSKARSAKSRGKKRPWEGSGDEEEESEQRRYGFGRVFSEEDDEDEEEDEDGFSVSARTSEFDDFDELDVASSSQFTHPPRSQIVADDEDDGDEFWAEIQNSDSQQQIPPLILSDSSVDLLIDKEHLMDTLEVYEVLKNYGSVLQLSPFLFEDFCAAIRSSRQSQLLCEIHMAFLRLFFREEDNEHTIFASQETTLSVSILIYLMDPMCFAEVLRHYVESDPNFSPDVQQILNTTNYPFVDLEKRLTVLKWMCERFFELDMFKKVVGGPTKIKHDDHCRSCGKAGGGFGRLLFCANCDAALHAHCDVDIVTNAQTGKHQLVAVGGSGAAMNGGDDGEHPAWRCPLCRLQVPGITDCLLPNQTSYRSQSRVTPLGRDRHGRLYWFMVRRIFVQDLTSGDIFYYSTLPQLYDLVDHLDPARYERRLCRALQALLPTIAMQMHCTLELTDGRWHATAERRSTSWRPYLHVDNVHRMSRIVGDLLLGASASLSNQQQQQQQQNGEHEVVDHDNNKELKEEMKEEQFGEVQTQLQNGVAEQQSVDEQPPQLDVEVADSDENIAKNAPSELLLMVQSLLCIKDRHLVATFWSAGMNESQLLNYCHHFADYEHDQSKDEYDDEADASDEQWWRYIEDPAEELNHRLNRGFRLGFADCAYLQWSNAYSAHPDLWRSGAMRNKERDKRKYLASRFAIAEEFAWAFPKGRDYYGSAEDVHRCLQLNLRRLVDRLPDGLMHRRWVLDGERAKFLRRLADSADVDSLRDLLLLFEGAIRRPVFLPVWWQSLAAIRFQRCTSEQRERRLQLDNLRRREEKSLATATPASSDADGVVWVRYTLAPARAHMWRTMKDEQYRINGLGEFGGWLWVSCTLIRCFLPLPKRPDIEAIRSRRSQEPQNVATRKARRLERVAKKLLCWRSIEHLAAMPSSSSSSSSSSSPPFSCYSANCRLITSGTPDALRSFCSVDGNAFNALPCYSASCARNHTDSRQTSGIFKAKPVVMDIKPKNAEKSESDQEEKMEENEDDEEEEVLGEQKPFPFPQPQDFKSRSGKRSILVLPAWFLRRLARQGGTDARTFLYSFHQSAKSNPLAWPYPCVRPLFFHCWRFLCDGARSLHALALRLRTLHACIRWADMEPDPDDEDPRIWSHHADCDEVRMVIGHKEHPPDGYYEQYLLRVDQYMLDDVDGSATAAEAGGAELAADDADDSANYRYGQGATASKRGGRDGRKRRAPTAGGYENGYGQKQQQQRKQRIRKPGRTLERWIDGVDLKLYEISWYWEDWLRAVLRQRQQQEQRARVEAEEAARQRQEEEESARALQARVPQKQQQSHGNREPTIGELLGPKMPKQLNSRRSGGGGVRIVPRVPPPAQQLSGYSVRIVREPHQQQQQQPQRYATAGPSCSNAPGGVSFTPLAASGTPLLPLRLAPVATPTPVPPRMATPTPVLLRQQQNGHSLSGARVIMVRPYHQRLQPQHQQQQQYNDRNPQHEDHRY